MSVVLGGASDLGEPSDRGRAPHTSDRRAAPVQETSQSTREVPLHTCLTHMSTALDCSVHSMRHVQTTDASHISNAHAL